MPNWRLRVPRVPRVEALEVKFLVTGALGHIGSRLIREIPRTYPGSHIRMLDNLSTQRYASLFDLPTDGTYRFVEADVTVCDLVDIVSDVDVVIHLAAMTDAASSVARAAEVERNNFEGTKRVAEACAACGKRLITLSSTSVYGTQETLVDENCGNEFLRPQSPYAETKLREERLVARMVADEGLCAVTLRFGTIFGRSIGMRFHTAVNKFCWQAAMRQPLTVWRTAYDQKRPYLDLGDACRAMMHICRAGLFDGRVYNVLTLNATVSEIVDTIRRYRPDLVVSYVDTAIMNQLSYEVSDARFRRTGFAPSGDLQTAIEEELRVLPRGWTRAEAVHERESAAR